MLIASAPVHSEIISQQGFSYTITESPSWVVSPEATTQPAPSESGVPARVLLIDEQIRETDSESDKFYHLKIQPLTQFGVTSTSKIEIEFNPAFEKLLLHEIKVLRDGTALNQLKKDNISLVQREKEIDAGLYDGLVTAIIVLHDVRIGDIIEYSYTTTGKNPVFNGHIFVTKSLGWKSEISQLNVRVLLPKGKPFHVKLHSADENAYRYEEGEWQVVHWRQSPVPAVSYEGETPDGYDPYPSLQISESETWNGVQAWANQLYKIEDKPLSNDLNALFSKWNALENRELAIRNALQFAQEDIRYWGIELGENSYRPSHPNDVFDRRFGDCKDKSIFLLHALKAMGINAYPALVATHKLDRLKNQLPTPGAFDHVITMVEWNGKRYWLDATKTYQRGTLDNIGFTDYKWALLANHPDSTLVPMNSHHTTTPAIRATESFFMTSLESPVALMVKTVYTHNNAEIQRYNFSNNSIATISKNLASYYTKVYPGTRQERPVTFKDDTENNTFTVFENYSIDNFWEADGKGHRYYYYFYGGIIRQFTQLPKVLDRKMPLANPRPIEVEQISRLIYPTSAEGLDDQEFMHIENTALSFTRTDLFEKEGQTVTFSYESRAARVDPENVRNHVEQIRTINNNLIFSAWIEAEAIKDPSPMDKLRTTLKKLLTLFGDSE